MAFERCMMALKSDLSEVLQNLSFQTTKNQWHQTNKQVSYTIHFGHLSSAICLPGAGLVQA